jgi:hypothetical protein
MGASATGASSRNFQRVGVDGQVNRAGQDRVHRALAGDRHQVQAAGICGDSQVPHRNLIRGATVTVLAKRDGCSSSEGTSDLELS